MISKTPLVSVVLNVYNESAGIENCLRRIRNQNYPQKQIEIIMVDDDSEDDTIERARKFNIRVVRSGYRNRERAKGIGIEHAKGEFILFMDADIFLIGNNWIKKAVSYLLENPSAVAVQNIRWQYKKRDFLANRYCNLFGINDPFILFLGKRGALMATEHDWPKGESTVLKTKDYYLVEFNPDNLPTMGAQGFMARRKLILQGSWKPYFFHLDIIYELVEKGFNQFILAKLPIEHQYIATIREFHEKLARNLTLFLELEDKRKYKYEVGSAKFFVAILVMMSLVYPFLQALRGYLKKPDPAWFLHPLVCLTVPIMYFFIFLKFKMWNNKIFYYLRIYGPGMFIWHLSWEMRMRLRWTFLKSFSQGDEDIIVDNLLGRNKKGFYVDVGAYHPKRFSNTERFYLRGWKGINIEPDPIKIDEFNKLRLRDINLNIGIANKNGVLNFFRFDPRTLSTFSKKVAKSNQKLGFNLTEKIKIKVYKLGKILEENYQGKQIDFFSIDTEGYDYETLKSNNWKKFKPKVICIEGQGNNIEKFLSKLGYKKVSHTVVNSIFLYSS